MMQNKILLSSTSRLMIAHTHKDFAEHTTHQQFSQIRSQPPATISTSIVPAVKPARYIQKVNSNSVQHIYNTLTHGPNKVCPRNTISVSDLPGE